MNSKIHKAQALILKKLLFNNGSTFAKLNVTDFTNDHFTYHIKYLLKKGYVTKKDKKYYLTQSGKLFASNLDIFNLELEKDGNISTIVCCIDTTYNSKKFLLQKRLKEPFYGYYGFVGGKVKFGEKPIDTATRELKEETNLKGKPLFIGTFHKLQGSNKDNILTDYYFFLYLVKNPQKKLSNTKEGENVWAEKSELDNINIFNDIKMLTDIFDKEENIGFMEKFYKIQKV